jgi:DNA-binding MarR family transcriptional regulator
MTQAKFRTSLKAIQKTRGRQLRAINQNQPRSTKKPRTIVPPPQSTRIMQRYAGGENIRQIAREEQRDRATVTKIVRSEEMQDFVQKKCERDFMD